VVLVALFDRAELGHPTDVAPTVLIVDDHAGFRRVAREILEADGYLVIAESATGGEALEAAARVQPAVVLLDIGLPDIDGIEVAGLLTAADNERPVILISSRDAADYEPLLARCGARGFIPKDELSGSAVAALAA
jgi:DNA-binding NarL/FixJ family response regulator